MARPVALMRPGLATAPTGHHDGATPQNRWLSGSEAWTSTSATPRWVLVLAMVGVFIAGLSAGGLLFTLEPIRRRNRGKPSASRLDRKTHAARLSWMDEELIKLGPTAPRSTKPTAYLALPIAAPPPARNAAPPAADQRQGITTAIPPA